MVIDFRAIHAARAADQSAATQMRCNRCHRPMLGTTAYDGACACGGLIEASTTPEKGA